MALQTVKNASIRGIAAAVPKHIESNMDLELLGSIEERRKFVETTGIEQRHTVKNSSLCTSDLCYEAAEKLLAELQWDKNEIGCLIFVSQTPDYMLPATACVLQSRLGLSQECFSLDISMGCSGWVYGLATICSMVSTGAYSKALLLAGDTVTVTKSPFDKSTYPLFGDAGTATAIEFLPGAPDMKFHFGTDGSNADSIMIKDGGFRYPFSADSLEYKMYDGIRRNNLQSTLNGAQVFTFAISKAPKSIKAVLEYAGESIENIDYVLLHQANIFMNDKIIKKIGADPQKSPNSIQEYGNTSSASIPLTIVSRIPDAVRGDNKKLIVCGFGVGFSWATAVIETGNLVCPDVIEV